MILFLAFATYLDGWTMGSVPSCIHFRTQDNEGATLWSVAGHREQGLWKRVWQISHSFLSHESM